MSDLTKTINEPAPLIYPKTIELHSDNSSNQQDGSIKQIISEVKEALDKLDECISKQNNQEVGNDQPAVSALKEHALSILGKRRRW